MYSYSNVYIAKPASYSLIKDTILGYKSINSLFDISSYPIDQTYEAIITFETTKLKNLKIKSDLSELAISSKINSFTVNEIDFSSSALELSDDLNNYIQFTELFKTNTINPIYIRSINPINTIKIGITLEITNFDRIQDIKHFLTLENIDSIYLDSNEVTLDYLTSTILSNLNVLQINYIFDVFTSSNSDSLLFYNLNLVKLNSYRVPVDLLTTYDFDNTQICKYFDTIFYDNFSFANLLDSCLVYKTSSKFETYNYFNFVEIDGR
jgi:hypothetical protein